MISLFGSHVGSEELEQIRESFEKQWIGAGPKCAEFERKISEKIGAPFVFLNSGSNSLQLAIRLLELPKNSEVILPTFTWIACANAIVLNELKPVFCDVDPVSGNLRPEDVSEKITPQTSAILVVHYAGKPVEFDALKTFGLPIIEDAAHAIDSSYNGKHCGTLGEVGIFSFDAVKNLTTGEGGGVICQDPAKIERAKKLRYCGIGKSGFQASAQKTRWWEYEVSDSFPKMLNNDIGAGIGLAQLKKLPKFQEKRRKIWDYYQKELSQADWLELPPNPEKHERHSYFTYCLRLKAGSRDRLAKSLYDRGVYSSLRFHPLHLNPIYQSTDSLPNAERLNEVALNIPLHHRLTDAEVEKIVKDVLSFKNEISHPLQKSPEISL